MVLTIGQKAKLVADKVKSPIKALGKSVKQAKAGELGVGRAGQSLFKAKMLAAVVKETPVRLRPPARRTDRNNVRAGEQRAVVLSKRPSSERMASWST